MNIFKQYVRVKEKLAELEEEKVALEIEIMNELDADGVSSRPTDYGQFAIMGRDTYSYSPAIETLKDELARAKKVEELTHVAILKSSSRHVRLILPKSNPIKERG